MLCAFLHLSLWFPNAADYTSPIRKTAHRPRSHKAFKVGTQGPGLSLETKCFHLS